MSQSSLSPSIKCLDTLDMIEGLKPRCETLVICAEVEDGRGGLECVQGFQGDPEVVAEVLAELIIAYQRKLGGSAMLYKAICNAKIREDAKIRQKELDDMDNANSWRGYK